MAAEADERCIRRTIAVRADGAFANKADVWVWHMVTQNPKIISVDKAETKGYLL